VYIGTDGIRLGQNFMVDRSGNGTMNNLKLTGTLNMGGVSITPQDLANRANNGNSAYSSVSSNGSYWSGGAAAGYTAKNFTDSAGNSQIGVGTLKASNLIGTTLSVNGYQATWMSRTVRNAAGTGTTTLYYLGRSGS
jgi:hypothetical protein